MGTASSSRRTRDDYQVQEDSWLPAHPRRLKSEYRSVRHLTTASYRWIAAHAVVVRTNKERLCSTTSVQETLGIVKQAEEGLKAEQRALRRMVLASDHERRLITYELHDGVAQQILGAMMLLESQEPPKGRKSKAAGRLP